MFQNLKEDYRSYQGDWGAQGLWVMMVYRFGRWRYTVRPVPVRKLFSLIYEILYKLIQVVTGIELPCEVEVGKNFIIDHFGGIVLSGFEKFGDDCRIRSGVAVGLKNIEAPDATIVGNHVDFGVGAMLQGKIRIGNSVRTGANSVVLSDVPDNAIAVGIPAIIKPGNPASEVAK
jgi:serine O-acetyltransferase